MNDFFSGKQVLITGAGGFIGSHLVEALAARGARVRAFVRYNSRGDPGLLSLLPGDLFASLDVIPGDLRDLPALLAACAASKSSITSARSSRFPTPICIRVEVVQSNVLGTMNILLAARETGVSRIVHTSTSEVYGSALRTPIDETHPLQGQSPYSASKIGADKLAESFYCAFGLPVVTVRPFNTYGPRQSARAVIPSIIAQALTQEVVRLGNLDARRDFTFVSDTVGGFLAAGQARGVEGQVFNLGVGRDIRIGDLAAEIFALLGVTREIWVDRARLRPDKSEVSRLISDNRRAAECLGWVPRVSLPDGLAATIDWISAHVSSYRPEKDQV